MQIADRAFLDEITQFTDRRSKPPEDSSAFHDRHVPTPGRRHFPHTFIDCGRRVTTPGSDMISSTCVSREDFPDNITLRA